MGRKRGFAVTRQLASHGLDAGESLLSAARNPRDLQTAMRFVERQALNATDLDAPTLVADERTNERYMTCDTFTAGYYRDFLVEPTTDSAPLVHSRTQLNVYTDLLLRIY
jgi:hypothetical protein